MRLPVTTVVVALVVTGVAAEALWTPVRSASWFDGVAYGARR